MEFFKKNKLLCGYILLALFSILAFQIRFPKYSMILTVFLFLLVIDFSLWKLILPDIQSRKSQFFKIIIKTVYFTPSLLLLGYLIGLCYSHPVDWPPLIRTHLMGISLMFYLIKFPIFLLLLIFLIFGQKKISRKGKIISYSFGVILIITFLFSTKFTTIDYKIATYQQKLQNLPTSFNGYKILQFSDLHIGSFAFPSSIEKLANEIIKVDADMILFSGDMVNFSYEEVVPYLPILQKIKAKDGVYCVLGNHDYGTYLRWKTPQDSLYNIQKIKSLYAEIGWICLDNKSVAIHKNQDSLVIAGVENWGEGARFPKQADMEKTLKFIDTNSCIVLLSHDPTYFTKHVVNQYKFIPLTLSGHTHAMQMGFKIGKEIISPARLLYKEFAGSYTIGNQTLFINIGSGFNGLPFRLGLKPELSLHILR